MTEKNYNLGDEVYFVFLDKLKRNDNFVTEVNIYKVKIQWTSDFIDEPKGYYFEYQGMKKSAEAKDLVETEKEAIELANKLKNDIEIYLDWENIKTLNK